MTALEYFKIKARMTRDCFSCYDCPLGSLNNNVDYPCDALELKVPEIAIGIVEKWAKEHSIKKRRIKNDRT